jgi:hypothetical protein
MGAQRVSHMQPPRPLDRRNGLTPYVWASDPKVGESTRWKKGRSGNPGGRPRRKVLREAYRDVLALRCPTDPERRTFAELIALRLATAAAGGDLKAAIELADRTEGSAPDLVLESISCAQPKEMDFSGLTREELVQRIMDGRRKAKELDEQIDATLNNWDAHRDDSTNEFDRE